MRRLAFLVAIATAFLWSVRVHPANQADSQPASSVNGITPPIAIGSRACVQFYPPIAIRLNQQGTTIVVVHLNAQGTVTNVSVEATSGHEALDAASIRCAGTWLFRPATKNGTPVEIDFKDAIHWKLGGRSAPPPVPFLPPGPPAGWEPEGSSPYLAGNLASYKLSEASAAEQYLSAKAYANISDLGDFVSKIDANLQNVKALRVLREERTTVCDGTPASEIEFSETGLLSAAPDRLMDIEQVRTVKNGWAYVTTYLRPEESPRRPDAEQWIHTLCGSHS